MRLTTLALASRKSALPEHQRASAVAGTSTSSIVAPRPSASAASSTPVSAQPVSSGSVPSSSAAPSASVAPTTVSADCVDLVPGKIPERGDADAAQKYRPPEWAKDQVSTFSILANTPEDVPRVGQAIDSIYTNLPGLDAKYSKWARGYIAEFYETINDPKKLKREIIDRCSEKPSA